MKIQSSPPFPSRFVVRMKQDETQGKTAAGSLTLVSLLGG